MKILKHLFGKRDKELDVLQEEALQSPLRTVVKNFYLKQIIRLVD